MQTEQSNRLLTRNFLSSMRITLWLFPALTGAILLNLSEIHTGFWYWVGTVMGCYYIVSSVLIAYVEYVHKN